MSRSAERFVSFWLKVSPLLHNFSHPFFFFFFQILPWLWEQTLLEDTQTVSMHMSPLTFRCVSSVFWNILKAAAFRATNTATRHHRPSQAVLGERQVAGTKMNGDGRLKLSEVKSPGALNIHLPEKKAGVSRNLHDSAGFGVCSGDNSCAQALLGQVGKPAGSPAALGATVLPHRCTAPGPSQPLSLRLR